METVGLMRGPELGNECLITGSCKLGEIGDFWISIDILVAKEVNRPDVIDGFEEREKAVLLHGDCRLNARS